MLVLAWLQRSAELCRSLHSFSLCIRVQFRTFLRGALSAAHQQLALSQAPSSSICLALSLAGAAAASRRRRRQSC
jgi:hypothetical protein